MRAIKPEGNSSSLPRVAPLLAALTLLLGGLGLSTFGAFPAWGRHERDVKRTGRVTDTTRDGSVLLAGDSFRGDLHNRNLSAGYSPAFRGQLGFGVRGTLYKRQSTCPTGQKACSTACGSASGTCCIPSTGVCCPTVTTYGYCDAGFQCANNGCCQQSSYYYCGNSQCAATQAECTTSTCGAGQKSCSTACGGAAGSCCIPSTGVCCATVTSYGYCQAGFLCANNGCCLQSSYYYCGNGQCATTQAGCGAVSGSSSTTTTTTVPPPPPPPASPTPSPATTITTDVASIPPPPPPPPATTPTTDVASVPTTAAPTATTGPLVPVTAATTTGAPIATTGTGTGVSAQTGTGTTAKSTSSSASLASGQTPSTTDNKDNLGATNSSPSIGVIVGASVGGLAVLAVLGFVGYKLTAGRKKPAVPQGTYFSGVGAAGAGPTYGLQPGVGSVSEPLLQAQAPAPGSDWSAGKNISPPGSQPLYNLPATTSGAVGGGYGVAGAGVAGVGVAASVAGTDSTGLTLSGQVPPGSYQPHWFFSHLAQPVGKANDTSVSYQGPPVPVIAQHTPNAEDEIALEPGNYVNLVTVFRDGWGIGRNLSTQAYGMIPLDCLRLGDFPAQPSGLLPGTASFRVESRAVAATSSILSQRQFAQSAVYAPGSTPPQGQGYW